MTGLDPMTPAQWERALAHRHLVAKVVRRRWRPSHEHDDAMQDGFIGLCRAVQRDTGERPEAFEAYASAWITSGIQNGRRRAEGVSYRRAILNGEAFQWPTSLDVVVGDHSDGDLVRLVDLRVDEQADTEAAALASLRLAAVRRRVPEVCVDVLDLDIALLLVRSDELLASEIDETVAAAHGATRALVGARRRRIQASLAAIDAETQELAA